MINVISFCLYGGNATYIIGMKDNILLGKKYYPDWEIRIYYNDTVPEQYIKEYGEMGAKCILCTNLGKNKMNWEGMVWRYFPLNDKSVHCWISRDADSRLSKRESDIVSQWMQSGKTLHCIRDHRCHYHTIMGGMFGINNTVFHKKYKFDKIVDIISSLYDSYKERPYNVDQQFLNNELWTLLKCDVMSHISNGGRRVYASDIEIPSSDEFIGKQYRLNDTISTKININLLDLVNKTFKIKNQYNDYCLDIENEKVKLKLISDSVSQLWTMDDKHRIIHYRSNKFLDIDNSKDLIISANGKYTWSIQEGGFIQNNINKMAIDIKGGLKDIRGEVWVYKINYSEAQQWDVREFKTTDTGKAKAFKIKNQYNDYCLDIEGEKVKLKLISDSISQLWTVDDKHRIIHYHNNKYLDFDNSKDLIISTNSKNTWSIQEGGLIQNNINDMAIDMKGGINDARCEAWLYKINHSEAQQWDIVKEDNNDIKTRITETKTQKIDEYFDQIYILHLNELTDRKLSIINQIKKFNLKNITIIDAINKNNIDMEKLKDNELIAYPGNNYCKTQIINNKGDKCWCNGGGHGEYKYPGRIACALSHYMCYKDIVNKNYKKCLILEDDFIFNDDLYKLFDSLYNDIPPDWELIYFQNSRYINYKGNQMNYNKSFVSIKYGVSDSGCYSVNNYAASVLHDNFLPIRAASDGYIGVCIDRIFKIKKAYVYKGNLSKNGSVSIFESVNDKSQVNDVGYNDKSLNNELIELVTSYNKVNVKSIYEMKNLVNYKTTINVLVLNHNFHHKNKRGLEMICNYLGYNLVYGSEKDIPDADVIYCPSHPFNASKYPNKRFVFGPHLSIFPDNKLRSIHNKDNSVYIQPSPWARDVWTNWKDMDAEKLIPIKSFPFPVEVDLFKPDVNQIKENVFVMFKQRNPEELKIIENHLNNNKVSYKSFRYGSYKQDDYLNYLKTCKYGIWIGRHESQGFALEESLSCNVPLLVWNVSNMRQQHGWNGCPDVYGITIPFWDKSCGEYFHKKEEFQETYDTFLKNLDNYSPREFISSTVSVKQCAENFERIFLHKKNNKKEFKLLTCANKNYFNALKQFINNVKRENIEFDKFIVYDIGLTKDQENELYILQAAYGFNIYKLDFSKYPEHVNLNLEQWNGLNNSYAFKPIIIHKVLQNINTPLIYLDCGCEFSNDTINGILHNISKNHFYISIANNKNSIESTELNYKTTLDYFNIKKTDIITCSANYMGIEYNNEATKTIINEWYNYSMKKEIISPIGSNRNNHRQDQTILSCILHNNKYNYYSNINVPLSPWKYKGSNTYYNKYKPFSCFKQSTNQYESRIHTNSLEEAIECYKNRKNISKEQLLKDFIIQ